MPFSNLGLIYIQLRKSILHITTWYPHEHDSQLGVFIQKHVHQGHNFANNLVFSIIAHPKFERVTLLEEEINGVKELQACYPTTKKNKLINYRNFFKILQLGLNRITELDFSPDFIHCHVAEKSLWIASRYFKDTPIFLTEHWSGYIDGGFEKLNTWTKRSRIRRINRCKKVFCVSAHLQKGMQEKGVKSSIAIVPNIIEHKRIKSNISQKFTFLVVADLDDNVKNISGILKAFKLLLNDYSEPRLTIIGDGIDRLSLQALSNQLDIGDYVDFKGRKDNEFVLKYLPSNECVVVNSTIETYSMVTAESLLSGVPVIATKCGGPEQFLEDGVNGYLIDVGDSKKLSEAMKKMIKNYDKLDFQGIHDRISTNLSIDTAQRVFKENILSQSPDQKST